MKKNIILLVLAAGLLTGAVVLMIPMFRADPATTTGGGGGYSRLETKTEFPLRADGTPNTFSPLEPAGSLEKPDGHTIVKYWLSEEYENLNASQKRTYREQVAETFSDPREPDEQMMVAARSGMEAMGDTTPEQQEAVRIEGEAIGKLIFEKRLANFFLLNEEEQLAIIDEKIDQAWKIEQGIRQWMDENPDDPWVKGMKAKIAGGGVDARTGPKVNAGMQWRQEWSPASRARWDEATRRYEARWDERGLPPSIFRNWEW
jgi:hypothetical protein